MATVTFDHVTKAYADGTVAVNDLELLIKDGEFLVLVGPSGCGKTTALRCAAGLEEITGGQIKIDARVVNRVPSKDRNIAMVFQSYALYPHMTVFDNLAFGLKLMKTPKQEIKRRVEEAAKILNLESLLDRKPRALSGGQRQRVALGRAIVREPAVFLMDEPLSNLDAKLRIQMRSEIAKLQHDLETTTIYVTHDQVEAMTMGDRIAVMNHGVLQQIGSPPELYDNPVNVFVAAFIGSPAMNFATAKAGEGHLTLGDRVAVMRLGTIQQVASPEELYDRPLNLFVAGFIGSPAMNFMAGTLEDGKLHTGVGDFPMTPQLRQELERSGTGRDVIVGIRPESFEDAAVVPAEVKAHGLEFNTSIDVVESLGSEKFVYFTRELGQTHNVAELEELARDSGRADASGSAETVVARLDPASRIRENEDARLWVDMRKLHVFDPSTGRNLSLAATDAPAGAAAPAAAAGAGPVDAGTAAPTGAAGTAEAEAAGAEARAEQASTTADPAAGADPQ